MHTQNHIAHTHTHTHTHAHTRQALLRAEVERATAGNTGENREGVGDPAPKAKKAKTAENSLAKMKKAVRQTLACVRRKNSESLCSCEGTPTYNSWWQGNCLACARRKNSESLCYCDGNDRPHFRSERFECVVFNRVFGSGVDRTAFMDAMQKRLGVLEGSLHAESRGMTSVTARGLV